MHVDNGRDLSRSMTVECRGWTPWDGERRDRVTLSLCLSHCATRSSKSTC